MDVSGHRIPGASRYQAALGADYVLPLGEDFELALHGDYSFRSAYFTGVDNQRQRTLLGARVISYGRVDDTQGVNARITLARPGQGWEAALWARNLFDEQVIVDYGNEFFGALTCDYSPPRTWGVEVSAKF